MGYLHRSRAAFAQISETGGGLCSVFLTASNFWLGRLSGLCARNRQQSREEVNVRPASERFLRLKDMYSRRYMQAPKILVYRIGNPE